MGALYDCQGKPDTPWGIVGVCKRKHRALGENIPRGVFCAEKQGGDLLACWPKEEVGATPQREGASVKGQAMKPYRQRRDCRGARPFGWRWQPGRAGRWAPIAEEQEALDLAWALWRGLWRGEEDHPDVPRRMVNDLIRRTDMARPTAEAWLLAGGLSLEAVGEIMGWTPSATYRRLVAYARRLGDSTCLFGSRFGECVQSTKPFARRTCTRLRCRVCEIADPYGVRQAEQQRRRRERRATTEGVGAGEVCAEEVQRAEVTA